MPMKNSVVPDQWIADAIRAVPFHRQANGNIITCPVRLHFCNIWEAKEGQNDDGTKKMSFNCAVLMPPGADMFIGSVLWPAWLEAAKGAFPDPKYWRADGSPNLHWPLHKCDDKQQYSGYTPGCWYFNVSSQFKPRITDTALNTILERSRVYDGVWAVLALNLYSYKNKKTGVSFGLQNVMLAGDDEVLTGGGTDPKEDFANVRLTPNYDPQRAFANPQPALSPPMGNIMPPATPVSAPPQPPGFGAPTSMPGGPPGYMPPPGAPQQPWFTPNPAAPEAEIDWDPLS